MDHFSERRMVENELLFRSANREVQRRIQEDRPRGGGPDTTKLHFYCECSSLYCRDRIKLTADEYEAATNTEKEFIVIPGHENGVVEKVVHRRPLYNVVEKYLDPAKVLKNKV